MTVPVPAALHHTCFIVPDLEAAARSLSQSLGIGPWNVWTIEPAEGRLHGRPAAFSFRVALTAVGGGNFELVSPHSGSSVYTEHLEKHGAGYHHTCLVYPTLEALREAREQMVRAGREIVQEASGGDVFEFAYVWFPEIGSAVELLYLDGSRLPAPRVV